MDTSLPHGSCRAGSHGDGYKCGRVDADAARQTVGLQGGHPQADRGDRHVPGYGDRLNAVLQADLLRPLQSGVHVPHSLRATGRERRNLLVALWLCWGARTSGYADLSSGRRHSLAIRSHSLRHPAGAGSELGRRRFFWSAEDHRKRRRLRERAHGELSGRGDSWWGEVRGLKERVRNYSVGSVSARTSILLRASSSRCTQIRKYFCASSAALTASSRDSLSDSIRFSVSSSLSMAC